MNNTTQYQDIFHQMDNIDPAAISQYQSPLSSLFPGMPSMIDDWLADELCKEGLLSTNNAMELMNEKHQGVTALLPNSPISPPTSKSTKSGSASPSVPLFPEISNTVQQQKKPAPVVAILPKSSTLPRIAPRPCSSPTVVMKPTTPIMMPATHSKRRLDTAADQDEIALKRQKNTDAARRSRMKKLVKMEQLEQRVSDLESDNNRLITRIAVLESEKSGLQTKDVSLEERIRVLESQLAEAHRALTKV